MSDIQKTRAQVLSLFADNVTGQISAQDLRDFVVTIMESEFKNPGDFWKQPSAREISTDKSGKGWIDYSQEIGSDVVFMDVVYLHPTSGVWYRAYTSNANDSGMPGIGLCLNSYTSGATDGQVLRKGIVYNSSISTIWSGNIGKPVYLCSAAPGSASITIPPTASVQVLGVIEGSDGNDCGGAKWRFDPQWSVKG